MSLASGRKTSRRKPDVFLPTVFEHDISFPEMIASVTDQPLKELDSAVKSRDSAAFARAYADLTDACNSCHQALNHGVVAIRVPSRTSPSNLNTSTGTRK